MCEDQSGHLTARLRWPALLALVALSLPIQLMVVLENVRHAHLPLLLLTGSGLLGSVALLPLLALRRVAPSAVGPVVLWYTAAWFLLSTLTGLHHPRLGTQPYLSHLILVAVAYLLLPLVPAGVVASTSALLLAGVAYTRPQMDPLLVSAVLYLGVLMSFMTVYGRAIREQRVRAELAWELQAHDGLTGLLSRRAALERVRAAFHAANTDRRRTALLLLNVDDFQSLNDTYGRTTGDEILQQLARSLRQPLNGVDLVARWGGDEFLLLVHLSSGGAVCAWAEDLRARVRAQIHAEVPGQSPVTGAPPRQDARPLTLSGGLALLSEADTADEALTLARARLLTAKIRGRDRLVCHHSSE